jgi:hypothetical protein
MDEGWNGPHLEYTIYCGLYGHYCFDLSVVLIVEEEAATKMGKLARDNNLVEGETNSDQNKEKN